MPAMTKTTLSDCSYPESMAYNIRDDIDATITRLKAVIDEEGSLRNALRALFDKRREEAIEQVRMANLHLHLVNQEEAAFCGDVKRASTKIREELGGSVTVGLLRADLAPQRPMSFEIPSFPPVQVEIGLKEDVHSRMSSPLHVDLSPRPDSMVDSVFDTSLRPPTILPVNKTFGFGASSTTNTGFAFGAGSQPPSASIGFGAASLENTGFGFGGASPTLKFDLRPGRPTFDAITDPMQIPAAVEETPASMDDFFANMMQDADIEDHNYNQNRFSTIDTLYGKAELWEPKSGTFHERRIPRNYALDDVEIVPYNGPKRTPQYESAHLPKKTPAYEDAPLPLPKSARMMPSGLPQHQSVGHTLGQEGRSVFGHVQPMPSPAKSQTSSQVRRAIEDDLYTPIGLYDQQDHDHGQNRFSTIDILDERAELWEPKSGTFHERKVSRSYAHDDVEIVPNGPVHHQDTYFLGTVNHPPPSASPSVSVRSPNAYIDTRNFNDSSMGPIYSNESSPSIMDQSENPTRTSMRQSMPITTGPRSSTSAMSLPPVQPQNIPWATGKTTTLQLPRPDTPYDSAPPPMSTTWGYVLDSAKSLAPLGPLSNGGLAFSVGGGMANQTAMYNLVNTSPNQMSPPGSTRSNIMQIPGTARSDMMDLPPPGSTRFNIMNFTPPGTGRSALQPLPSQSQIMLAEMLGSQGLGPEIDEDPIIPSGGGPDGGWKKKKGGRKRK